MPILFHLNMKNILIFTAILIVFSCSAWAQDPTFVNPKAPKVKQITSTMRVPTGNDMNQQQIFYFNSNGELDSISTIGFGGRHTTPYPIPDTKEHHKSSNGLIDTTFAGGKINEITIYDPDGDKEENHTFNTHTGQLSSSIYMVYRKPHSLSMEKTFVFRNGKVFNIYYFTINKKGQYVKQEVYTPDERLITLTKNKFNSKGLQTKSIRTQYDDNGAVESRYTQESRYTYDKEGNWISMESYYNGKLVSTTTREIIYW